MQNAKVKQFNIFNKHNFSKKQLCLFLCAFFAITAVLAFVIAAVYGSDDLVNSTPSRIDVVDNSSSEADNTAWFNGYTDNGIVKTVLDRYSSYGTDANQVSALLGEESHPYIIENGLELADLAKRVNDGNSFSSKYIVLAGSKKSSSQSSNVIDLISTGGLLYQSTSGIGWVPCDSANNNTAGWEPIGNSESNTFDGNITANDGVKIYNLSANITGSTVFGLFGYLGTNANVSNLNLYDTQIYNSTTSGSKGSVVIGTIAGISKANQIKNCTVNQLASGKRTQTADGTNIVSTYNGSSYDYYVVPDFMENSAFTDSIVGGLVGRIAGQGEIVNCQVNGQISVSFGYGVGNIIGEIYDSANSTSTVSISNITGNCSIVTPDNGYMHNVGGVVGRIKSTKTAVNISNVGTSEQDYSVRLKGNAKPGSGNDTTGYGGFGGVVGYSLTNSILIDKCYVSVDACLSKYERSSTSNRNFYFGGILGRNQSATASSVTFGITNCVVNNTKFYSPGGANTIYSKISTGGIVGGINYQLSNSYVDNCVVNNLELSTDGLSGGIIGTGMSSGFSNIERVKDCEINGLEIIQESVNTDTSYVLIGGITATTTIGTTIDSCTVNDFSIDYTIDSKAGSYNQVGGIVGRSNGGVIKNSSADCSFNIINTITPSGLFVGGICGIANNTTIENCSAIIDQNQITSIVNKVGLSEDADGYTFEVASKTLQNYVSGGIVAYVFGKGVSISNSYSTGDINCKVPSGYTIGDRQNIIGGLVGTTNSGISISNSFSTVSLSGNLKDAIGGLIGYNSSADTTVNNCYYGGALLDPNAASIVKYSNGGTYTNIYKFDKLAPNLSSADGSVATCLNSDTVPSSIATAVAGIDDDYYKLATTNSVQFNGDHVFAVTDDLGSNGYEIKDNSYTYNDLTVHKRIKLVQLKMASGENGCQNSYTVSTSSDLEKMQQYVAVGGGFLGAKYVLNENISTSLNTPIGMADSSYKFATDTNLPFCGEFNGNGKTISYSARSNSGESKNFDGLFGYIENSSIENLNIVFENNAQLTSNSGAGSLVGVAVYSNINGVSVKANKGITLSSGQNGGICGISISTSFNTEGETALYFSGKISASKNLGGLIGFASNDKPSFYINEAGGGNNAELKGSITFSASYISDSIVKHSYVSGDVVGSTNGSMNVVDSSNTASNIGGLIGSSNSISSLVSSSFMYGNVTGGKCVGGIIGYLATNGTGLVFDGSYVRGNIYANSNAGGIIGFVKDASLTQITVTGAYFVGQINCTNLFGALSSSKMSYANFQYDKQVCGDISIYPGLDDDEYAEKTTSEFSTATVDYSDFESAYDICGGSIVADKTYLVNSGEISAATFKFSTTTTKASWAFTSGTYPSDKESRVVNKYSGNRLAIDNSAYTVNTMTGNSVTVTFNGTYFDLYSYISTGHDAYVINIDGADITNNSVLNPQFSTYKIGSTTYSKVYSCSANAQIGTKRADLTYLTKSQTGDYSTYVSSDVGLPADTSVKSFSVSNLSNTVHTITISGYRTKTTTSSYMNIRGFAFGSISSGAGFDEDTNYPEIDFFVNNLPTISNISTTKDYLFSGDDSVTSKNFSASSILDIKSNLEYGNSNDFSDDLSLTSPISRNDNQYSVSGNIDSGDLFTVVTHKTVNDYVVNIEEKIVVVPFQNGSGTKDDPYGIINVSQLVAFKNFINETYNGCGLYFKLTMTTSTSSHSQDGNVYDLTGDDQTHDSDYLKYDDSWESIGTIENKFQGNFDGNGKIIKGLNIESSDAGIYGLFGYTVNAKISSVEIDGDVALSFSSKPTSPTYVGLLIGFADSTNVSKVTAKLNSYTVSTNTVLSDFINAGGVIGEADNSSKIENVLVYGKMDLISTYTSTKSSDRPFYNADTTYENIKSNSYWNVGGIIGYGKQSNIGDTLTVNSSITNLNIKTELTDKDMLSAITVGGAVGYCAGGDSTSVVLNNISTFGTIKNDYGRIGGIIGSALSNSASRTFTATNCFSTASILFGNSEYGASANDFYAGGIAGYINFSNSTYSFTDCTFAGDINFAQPNGNINISLYLGGIVGRATSNSSLSARCYFDVTKNNNLPLAGDSDPTDSSSINISNGVTGADECKPKTSAALSTNGIYNYSFGELNFVNTSSNTTANAIIDGNTVLLGLVRTDYVFSVYSSTSSTNSIINKNQQIDYMQLSSAFVTGNSGATLGVLDSGENSLVTSSSRRVVATKDSTQDLISVKVQKNVGGDDQYLGQGKEISFYPSTKDVGKADASAFCADFSGDGFEKASKTYTIFHADQLSGVHSLLIQNGEDGYGNPVFAIDGGYELFLNNDIDFNGIDYDTETDGVQSLQLGNSTSPFTESIDGQEHTVFGLNINSSNTSALFASTNGASIKNLGITDSVFTLSSGGSAGSFAGISNNTSFENCFSSARVELGISSPSSTYLGGMCGSGDNNSYSSCFFTGSVGIMAKNNDSYIAKPDSAITWFSGAFEGYSTGEVQFSNCYASTYIDGATVYDDDSETYIQNIGYFSGGKSNDATISLTNCSVSANSGASGCRAIGGDSSSNAGNLTVTNGLYPSVWSSNGQSAREIASRIATTFSTSAASMSRVEISVGSLCGDSENNYYSAYTVYGTTIPLYDLDLQYATRSNSGMASILVKYTDETTGDVSYRMIVMNLQCWYDNFSESSGIKTYEIKNYSDLIELSQMVKERSDANVGHSHSVNHTGKGIAEDGFDSAVIKLAANIIADGEPVIPIGDSATPFNGSFDGNGYVISNISLVSNDNKAGLFGNISNTSVIKNVLFTGTTSVTVDDSSNSTVYGGLVLADYSNGTVTSCMNESQISITNNSNQSVYFGGIVGNISSTSGLDYCYNMGHIIAKTDGMFIAGIAGNNNGTISICYNTGIIEGYTDKESTNYVAKTTTCGIAAKNDGTVSECYNAALLMGYGKNLYNPIAMNTVSNCYVNGQTLCTDFDYKNVSGGYEYSNGITVLSADALSNGQPLDSFGNHWTYNSGYYPQFSIYYGANAIGGTRLVSSSVSALATTLVATNGDVASYDNFLSVSFNYGSTPFLVEELEGSLATFSRVTTTTGLRMVVQKRGASTLFLSRQSADVQLSRETYFINEETFSVHYMFDFSNLTNDADECSKRVVNGDTNTFSNSSTRVGQGTAGDPYIVSTAKDLQSVAEYINASTTGAKNRYFKLMSNIDCSSLEKWIPIGTNDNPFKGYFNGNGFTISGINSSNNNYNGLFGYIGNGAEVTLVAIDNSKFVTKTATLNDTYTGAIAAYCDGTITNCYSRAIINIPTDVNYSNKKVYAGGLVGELGENGLIQASYARPYNQSSSGAIADGNNTIDIYSNYIDLVCGILVGKVSGTIDGVYHTSVYYTPTGGTSVSPYGVICGQLDGGTLSNVFYDSNLILGTTLNVIIDYNGQGSVITGTSNSYGKSTSELKKTESSATTNGVANDSMALSLSDNIYLGSYEMKSLPTSGGITSSYSNDGYPMLTAFDVLQYKFKSFDSTNFVMFMQNIDSSSPKLMNALCDIDGFSFPTYADITAKERLSADILSLPKNIGFNISAVGYGHNDDGQIKWTVVNGKYTNTNKLNENIVDDDNNVISTAYGSGMIDRTTTNGRLTIPMGTANMLPSYCDKLNVYITFIPGTNATNEWGISHTWSSAELEEAEDDPLVDE